MTARSSPTVVSLKPSLSPYDHQNEDDPQPIGRSKRARVFLYEAFETERQQAIYWLPVLLGAGAAIYFSLPTEPPLIFTLVIGLVLAALATLSSWPWRAFAPLIVLAAGFTLAHGRTALLEPEVPLIKAQTRALSLTAKVLKVETQAGGGVRLHLTALQYGRGANPTENMPADLPAQVRLVVRTHMPEGLTTGDWVSLRAILRPLPGPIVPGGYDFGRRLYFDGYQAIGFSVSEVIKTNDSPDKSGRLDRVRTQLRTEIDNALDGAQAGLAKALLLGERRAVPEATQDNFREAGLAHLLAISGLHMGLIIGCVFVVLRRTVGLLPGAAIALPVKSIAAMLALGAVFGYLALVGAPVSAQRATLMACVVILGVLFCRQAISLRTTALVATVMIVLAPENVVDIGFQMSFAAVTGLIVGFAALRTGLLNLKRRWGPVGGTIAAYVAGVFLSTIFAEIAILPVSLYHFQEMPLYGLIGNALAVPLTAFLIMPAGLAALVMLPVGMANFPLEFMGWGLSMLDGIAAQVARTPYAVATTGAISASGVVLIMFAAFIMFTHKSALRWLGIPFGIAGMAASLQVEDMSLYVRETGSGFAMQTQDGRFKHHGLGRSSFLREVLSRHAGQSELPRLVPRQTKSAGAKASSRYLRCDANGCSAVMQADAYGNIKALRVGISEAQPPSNSQADLNQHTHSSIKESRQGKEMRNRIIVDWIKHPSGLYDACRPGHIVISQLTLGGTCANASFVLDAQALAVSGARSIKLRRDGERIIARTQSTQSARPWSAQ